MKIGIIGLNKVSKFYAIILAQYGHKVIIYEGESPLNNFIVDKIILEESFFNNYIKNLGIFKSLNIDSINIEIIEKFLVKENIVNDKFIRLKDYQYVEDFNFEKIPNIEIVNLNSSSITQIKMMEDILIIDSPDRNLLQQIDLIKLNNWTSLYMQADIQETNFQITKEGKYSIFAINENNNMEIFINTKESNKKEVIKIISKKCKNVKIIDQQKIEKYDNYAYKNIAIINTALVEYSYPYRDYSLLVQIIQNTESKKIFSKLDIYSDIKSQVI